MATANAWASRFSRRGLLWIWVAIVSAYFLWEAAGYRGLFGTVCEWELRQFGGRAPMLTMVVLALILIAPAALLARRRKRDIETNPVAYGHAGTIGTRTMRLLWAVAAAFGLVAAGVLLYALFALPDSGGKIQPVTIGAPGPAPYQGLTRLSGVGSLGRVVVFRQRWPGDLTGLAFAPAFATPAHDRAVTYFIELSRDEYDRQPMAIASGPRTGILVRRGLPGTMTTLYRNLGYTIPRDYYVLYVSDLSLRMRYYLAALQFAGAGLLIALAGLWQRRHVRKLRERESDGAGGGALAAAE